MGKMMTYAELKEKFRAFEREHHQREHLTGYIVFTEGSFDKHYPKKSRTYIVSSDNKAFQPNKAGYSIYGSCLDGTDQCVRLEKYMAEEQGGKDGWVVDHCYMKQGDGPQKQRLGCPLGGDESNDCGECAYSPDYHYVDGECVRRDDNEE